GDTREPQQTPRSRGHRHGRDRDRWPAPPAQGAAHLRPLPQASGSHAGRADRLLDSSSSADASALDSEATREHNSDATNLVRTRRRAALLISDEIDRDTTSTATTWPSLRRERGATGGGDPPPARAY